MKITECRIYSENLKLKSPYTIAYETISHAPHVFLEMHTSETEITGFGCAAPDLEITGETIETVEQTFREHLEPVLQNSDPLRISKIMHKVRPFIMTHPSCLAMVNMALYDILGQRTKLPLYLLLGGFRKSIKTSITIGILPVHDTVKQAEELIKQGFKALKVKGGECLEEDIEKIIRVRESVGPSVELRFDANQGYTVADTLEFFARVVNANIELIEQPTKRENPVLMKNISERIPIPIMADESLMNLKDAFKLAKKGFVDMINIKLMKVGGISEAIHINSVSKSAGLEVMVGCMDESALSIAAGLHFALSRPNILYADLDGHFDLQDDPFKDTVILKDGYLFPKNKPGLGVY